MTQIPDRWHDLGEFIREQRSTARLSLRKLSELAGISNPYLSQIERGLRKPSAETLYIRAGILEERTDDGDLDGEILRDRFLTEEQKQMLIQVYRAFRHENEGKVMSPASGGDDEIEDEEETAAG